MKGEGYDQKLKAYYQYNDTTHTEMLFLNKAITLSYCTDTA